MKELPVALSAPHLADTTVWSKVRNHPQLAQWFNEQVRHDRVATCDTVALELLRSARNSTAFREQATMLAALQRCPTGTSEVTRAREIQARLAERGQHRGVPPADLLIAASAESAGVALLHYDHDFELIASVSGQLARWLVPAGSLP